MLLVGRRPEDFDVSQARPTWEKTFSFDYLWICCLITLSARLERHLRGISS